LQNTGKLDAAIDAYHQGLALDPKNDHSHYLLGTVLQARGKLDAAIDAYRQALALDPKNAFRHHRLGRALQARGQLDAAIDAYRQAIELDPNLAVAHNDLAWLLATCPDAKLRDPKRAIELANKAVRLTPKDGTTWNTLGAAHYRTGDWKAAIEALNKSDELLKGNEFSFNAFFLAMAHWRLGARAEAHTWYDRAVAWMEKNRPQDEELRRFRAEAVELLNIKK
jgi:tetratricopeptide (TPR) repeat protein